MNAIVDLLRTKNVSLPEGDADLSGILREAGVQRSYAIVMSGRCGSTWLATALKQTGKHGFPMEYFSEEGLVHFWRYDSPQSFEEVFGGILTERSSEGVFGFKINPFRLFWLNEIINVAATFNQRNCAWIYMKRDNILAQAFSFARAKHTGVWHQYSDRPAHAAIQNKLDLSVLEPDVWYSLRNILIQEHGARRYFSQNKIFPTVVTYEELLDAPRQIFVRVASEIRAVLDPLEFLSIEGTTVRLSDERDETAVLEFIAKHSQKLAELYRYREHLSLEQIEALCEIS